MVQKNQNTLYTNINDSDILDFLYIDSKGNRCNRIVKYKLLKLPDPYKNYLLNRYKEELYKESDFKEIVYRIKNGIDKVPKCPICGNPCKFNGIEYNKTCCYSCRGKLNIIELEKKSGIRSSLCKEEVKQKSLITIKNIYGEKIENVSQAEIVKNKKEKTCLDRYGVLNPYQIDTIKYKCIKNLKLNKTAIIEKRRKTNLEKYGYEWTLQQYKGKRLPDHIKIPLINAMNSKEVKEKRYNTLKKNNTFRYSKIEEDLNNYLIINNIAFERQYKSDKYPYYCDFYFPDVDFYLEIQGNWTHGFKPFENTKEDLEIVKKWESKNTAFYKNAIKNWTITDVQKRNIAKKNKLKFIEVFSIKLEDIISVLKNNKII